LYSTFEEDQVGGRVSNLCHPCDRKNRTTPATLLCSPCNERLCEECCYGHEIYTPGKHSFVDYHDNTKKRSTLVDMKGFDKCKAHGNAVVYKCESHNELCCKDCHFDSHKTCDKLLLISQLAEADDTNNDPRIADLISDCISMAHFVASTCNIDSKSAERNYNQDNEMVCYEIERAKETIIQLLDDAKKHIQPKLADSNKSEIKQLQTWQSTALNLKMELEKSQSVNDSVQKRGTKIQKYIMKYVRQRLYPQAESEISHMQYNHYAFRRGIKWNQHLQAVLNMHQYNVAEMVGNQII